MPVLPAYATSMLAMPLHGTLKILHIIDASVPLYMQVCCPQLGLQLQRDAFWQLK